YNMAKLGRRWFGDRFGIENEKSFEFEFPNLIASEHAKIKVYLGATAEVATTMGVSLNETLIATVPLIAFAGNSLASVNHYVGDQLLNSENVTVALTYNNNGNPASSAYLDYVSIEATRQLRFEGQQFFFKNNSVATSSGVVEYVIENTGAVSEVWDVTNKYEVTTAMNSDNASTFSFKAIAGTSNNYLVVTPSNYYQPLRDNNVAVRNQNLKGTIFKNEQGLFQDVDYIIVASNNYLGQA